VDGTQILRNIGRHIQLDAAEEAQFLSLLVYRKLQRRQFLVQETAISRYVAFVNSGCLRAYTVDDQGIDHILQFAPTDWWITDMYSFITQKAGTLHIDALEPSEVWLLSRTNQEQLFHDIPKFERFFRIITEKSLVAIRQRLIDNLSLSAAERFDLFCRRYPELLERIPQKQIAAFIGVTPEFFSKLKAAHYRKRS
jgi:CRP-like cAMP-binding protein